MPITLFSPSTIRMRRIWCSCMAFSHFSKFSPSRQVTGFSVMCFSIGVFLGSSPSATILMAISRSVIRPSRVRDCRSATTGTDPMLCSRIMTATFWAESSDRHTTGLGVITSRTFIDIPPRDAELLRLQQLWILPLRGLDSAVRHSVVPVVWRSTWGEPRTLPFQHLWLEESGTFAISAAPGALEPSWNRPRQVSAEPIIRVGPGGFDLEAGAQKEITNAGDRVLVTVLRVDAFTLAEWNFKADQLDLRGLVEGALEMHFDAGELGVPQGEVAEEVEIEVAAEFAVDTSENVLVEARGHAFGVVVGGEQNGCIFHQVCSEQQVVASVHVGPHSSQQIERFIRLEIPNA